MSAKIIIEFERILIPGTPDYYYLHTTVFPDSIPPAVQQCLVVNELGVSVREEMVRIAEFADIPLLDTMTVVTNVYDDPTGLSPAAGDRYLVRPPGYNAWAGQGLNIATWSGTAWSFIEAAVGMAVWLENMEMRVVFDGAAWVADPGSGLELLPDDVNEFEDASLPFGLAVVGDIIKISAPMPPVWDQVMASPTDLYYGVAEILNPPNNTRLRVTPAYTTTELPPTPETGFEYRLLNASMTAMKYGPVTTGKMDRIFDGLGPGPYRTVEHHDLFLDATVATNRINALRAQADTLVSQINDDTFTGTTTETFE
jgi:hypothetical protein